MGKRYHSHNRLKTKFDDSSRGPGTSLRADEHTHYSMLVAFQKVSFEAGATDRSELG